MNSKRLNIDNYSRSLSYLLGGVFLLTLATANFFDKALGWIFGGFALLLMIVAITQWNRAKTYTDQIHGYLSIILFLVSFLRFDMFVLSTHKIEFLVLGLIFPLLVILGWGMDMKRNWNQIKSRIVSKGRAPIRIPLYFFGSILLFLAIYFRGWGVNAYGNPLLYLAASMICLGFASQL
jgi:hypothetical protein